MITFNIGKLYLIKKHYWLLYPTKDIAAAAASVPCATPDAYAAYAANAANAAADAAYWSNRFKFNCIVSYISPNSIFCLLEQDEKFLKILSTNAELGWMIYPEDAEWAKGCIEEVSQ